MRNRVLKITAMIAVLVMVLTTAVLAEGMISTTVVMRVSQMTQNAVVDAGKDLSMEVNIDGVIPASYQWYFNDVEIVGANQKVYSIVNAQPEDTGIYRLDAYDANGKLVVSMDISARVIDNSVPKSGDASLPIGAAVVAVGVAAVALTTVLRRRQAA